MVYVIMQVRGAARVILIDNVADRLSLAQSKIPGLEIIDFNKVWQLADTLHCTMSAGLAQYKQYVRNLQCCLHHSCLCRMVSCHMQGQAVASWTFCSIRCSNVYSVWNREHNSTHANQGTHSNYNQMCALLVLQEKTLDALKRMTEHGPDVCIEAVGAVPTPASLHKLE